MTSFADISFRIEDNRMCCVEFASVSWCS